jgi:transcriptional regulator with XRE-family HTH domain
MVSKKKGESGKSKPKIRINRVKAVLLEQEITQTALAERVGLSKNSIKIICNNQGQPTLEHLRDIALALGVNIQTLLIPTPDKSKIE